MKRIFPSRIFTLIKKGFRYVFFKIRFFFKEKTYKKRLKYIYEDNGSDELIVVFSGFAKRVPKYNYMRTLKAGKMDKLFILDDFGSRGSYHWFVNGTDLPLQLTNGLIDYIKAKKPYKKLYTAGSSKGGTCAIYFGLEHNADEVFAGACQYYVGKYIGIPKHRDVLEGMMGEQADEQDVRKLDEIMPASLEHHAHSKTLIHLCYSKAEHTYPEHIEDLIRDLDKNDINYVEKEDYYTDHADNGIFFAAYLKNYFGLTKTKNIIFILNSIQIQRVVKRINSFCDAGYSVEVYAFSRVGDAPCPLKTHFEYDVIGEFPNKMSYLNRLLYMRKSIKAKANYIKKQNSILYIFGLDAAIVTRSVLKIPYVYEEADLVHTYISNGFVRGLLEKLDRRIIKKSLLTVLTSEGFMDYHFGKERPSNLLEVCNKLNQAVTEFPIREKQPLDINHLKIGFVGSFRFNAVINFCKVFVAHFPQHELHVFGTMPENSPARVLLEKKNFIFHGPFKNPDDLPGIYSQIDLSLSTYDADTVNAKHAEPNKLYEAIYFETPIIASSNTFVADKVKRLGIGFDIDASKDNEIIHFVENLTKEQINTVVERIKSIDKREAINDNTELFKRIDVIVGTK